ncbi:hypothetical protein EDB84DRAFT_167828 [Lactarius hengduanensis]|nr:hypothetical protein EDB84DRAFT_167828 [Lactarius hengduanensis]
MFVYRVVYLGTRTAYCISIVRCRENRTFERTFHRLGPTNITVKYTPEQSACPTASSPLAPRARRRRRHYRQHRHHHRRRQLPPLNCSPAGSPDRSGAPSSAHARTPRSALRRRRQVVWRHRRNATQSRVRRGGSWVRVWSPANAYSALAAAARPRWHRVGAVAEMDADTAQRRRQLGAVRRPSDRIRGGARAAPCQPVRSSRSSVVLSWTRGASPSPSCSHARERPCVGAHLELCPRALGAAGGARTMCKMEMAISQVARHCPQVGRMDK